MPLSATILSPSAPPPEDSKAASPSLSPKRTHGEAFSSSSPPFPHPTSPAQHRAKLSSAGEPQAAISSGSGGGADDGGGGTQGGQEEKKPSKMVRSSIACSRCRRSKVKCINTGVNSVCKACNQSNRECTYPPSSSTAAPKRPEVTPSIKTEDGETKKRIRKTEDSGRRNSHRPAEDPLDSPLLTRKMWDELYDIFKLHFSTEMPFLHPPTFRNRMRQASYPRESSSPTTSDSPDGRVLLLGVLTLTARFHPELVAHHSPQSSSQPSDPQLASEYYATALAAAFRPSGKNLANLSLDGIQALLMLGLYEWGQSRGLSAWIYVGIAIRLAQSMGFSYLDDPNSDSASSRPMMPHESRQARMNRSLVSPRDDAIGKEVRRRTFWSCFNLDRMLSAGRFRPTMIQVEKLRVQLPCSDDQFLFVHKVQTGFLHQDWLEQDQTEAATKTDDAVLSRYIRLVDIFGRFSEWSYAGGRRTESLPPWDKNTEFYKLGQQLEDFHAALPSNLTYTEANLSAHIEKRNATTYTSMHTLYLLCLIVLHREYLPFIPLRCDNPQGPLDEPTFPEDKFAIPPGFWDDSATRIFKAARDIVDIVRTCQDNNALPESPQIGFAVWQAAFVCVYAVHFPHMNPTGSLQSRIRERGVQMPGDPRDKSYASVTVKILGEMVPRLKMAKGYLKTIGKMHTYFHDVKNEFYNQFKRKPLHWEGGGLEQYKFLEKELKEFGSLEDADKTVASDGSDSVDPSRSRASTNEIGQTSSLSGEPMQGIEGAPPSRPNGTWAPINAASPVEGTDGRGKPGKPTAGYNYGITYQQPTTASSNPPGITSPSNADTASALNSPLGTTQVLPYQGSGQVPQIMPYSSMAEQIQTTMAPPSTQAAISGWTPADQSVYNEELYERYMGYQEGISMSSAYDGLPQAFPVEEWNGHQGGHQQGTGSYLEVVWTPGNISQIWNDM